MLEYDPHKFVGNGNLKSLHTNIRYLEGFN